MEKYISKISKNAVPVTISKDAGAFFVMSDGMQVKKEALLQNYNLIPENNSAIITESERTLSPIAQKLMNDIKNLDTSKIRDDGKSGRVLDTTDQTSINQQIISPTSDIKTPDVSMYKYYDNDDDVPVDNIGGAPIQKAQVQQIQQEPVKTVKPKSLLNENGLTEQQEHDRQEQITLSGNDPYAASIAKYKKMKANKDSESIISSPNINITPEEDKSYEFFKKMKNIHDVKLKIVLDEKIADPHFIKMMAMNMEGDIIKYYTKTILNKLDMSKLEKIIYDQLTESVFGKSEKKDKKVIKKKKAKRIIPTMPKSERVQTNGVQKG